MLGERACKATTPGQQMGQVLDVAGREGELAHGWAVFGWAMTTVGVLTLTGLGMATHGMGGLTSAARLLRLPHGACAEALVLR